MNANGAVSCHVYVLDTNVWLDWLVFSHDAIPALQAAQHAGDIEIIYTAAMRIELADVLSRAHFALTVEQQEAALAMMSAVAREVSALVPTASLRCTDRDDQIFIDTALAYHVDWLLSKDKHLLALRHRALKMGVRVASLDAWWSESQP